jgi:hypothetical protein
MQLIVLYREDGRIVALSRVAPTARDEAGILTPRSGVEADEGQRVAIVDLEPVWHDRPLADIQQHCTIVHDGDRVRLHERETRAT